MNETGLENNVVKIGGVVASGLESSHELYGEQFYKFYIEIDRLSGQKDRLPVIVSERLIDINNFPEGTIIKLEGQYRSYNQMIGENKSKLILTVFVKNIEVGCEEERVKTLNELTMIGTICKPPVYRKTPLGRDIADILLAVNRAYNKSDYIPCILWGRNAKFCEKLSIGADVKVVGRIQARAYEKKFQDGTSESRVAYEVSVSKFEKVRTSTFMDVAEENIENHDANENEKVEEV